MLLAIHYNSLSSGIYNHWAIFKFLWIENTKVHNPVSYTVENTIQVSSSIAILFKT